MLSNQCVSITDLRTKTKECLEDLWSQEKYVFVNNKPVAVLMDVAQFEKWETAFDFQREHINQEEFIKYLANSKEKWQKGWNIVVDFGEKWIDATKLLTIHKKKLK